MGRAFAQADGGRFSEDFEGPTLLTTDNPAGQWGGIVQNGGVTLALSPLAAHRGDAGIRVTDNNTAATSQEAYLSLPGLLPTATDYRVRFWFRGTPGVQANDSFSVAILLSAATHYHLEVELGDATFIAGHDRNDVYSSSSPGPGLLDGGWHLVEGVVNGFNGPNATRRFFLNGSSLLTDPNVDFTSAGVVTLRFGKAYNGNESFTGTLDFDDVRVSPLPLASTLTVSVDASTPLALSCLPLEVGLKDSETGAAAPAPYGVDVSVPSAQLFSDLACGTAASTLTIAAGATNAIGSVIFTTTGAMSVRATHPDFIDGTTDVVLGTPPDAGATDAGTLTPLPPAPPTVVQSTSGTPRAFARCGEAFDEWPLIATTVIGTPPLEWSLTSAPDRMTIDASSGELSWRPTSSEVGVHSAVAQISNAVGSVQLPFEVEVTCGPPRSLLVGCGCDSPGALSAWGFVLALVVRALTKKRHG